MRFLPLVLLLAAGASAQAGPEVGRVAVVVVAADSGEPVPGASMMVEELRIGAYSDLDGRAALDGVPVGEYVVSFRSPGFDMVSRRVIVRSGATTAVRFSLPGREPECVVLCAEAPWTATGLYAARVVRYVAEPSCCDNGDAMAPLSCPRTFQRDR
ncbi:carboxypeptidase regulatory-like domain-containing protein [Rubrivirga sp. IMCC43871]|uniref:carboxypeptidase regulatory-like domain-containing protein n=1 Tax=Rubrivirga sp. IMCC43871 TaxID=3391575 RepID=UPI00398FE0A8